jgi:hypothetical protein
MESIQRSKLLALEWGERVRADKLAAGALEWLYKHRAETAQQMLDTLRRDDPDFQRAADDKFINEALAHAGDHFRVMLAIGTARAHVLGTDPFCFVRSHAVVRARQHFPLAASLHGYRVGRKGSFAVIREVILSRSEDDHQAAASLLLVSDFLMEYLDVTSTILTEAYVAEEKLIGGQQARVRVALTENLLRGLPPDDQDGQELLARSGLNSGAPMAIAVARPLPGAGNMQANTVPLLRSLAHFMERILVPQEFGRLVDIRNVEVIVIASNPDDAASGMAQRLRRGIAESVSDRDAPVGIGVSLNAVEIAQLPLAYQEAEYAFEFADAAVPVFHFADIDLLDFVTRRQDPAALRLIPDWMGRLTDLDAKTGEICRTVRAFAQCNLNVKLTARCLKVHTNTVYFRLNRVQEITKVDPRTFHGLSRLLIAMNIAEARDGRAGSHRA